MSQHSQPEQLGRAEFGKRLRQLRTAKGLTQRELAGDSLSVSYVSLLEAGRRTPTESTVSALAAILGCTEAELLGGKSLPAERPTLLTLRLGQLALAGGDAAEAHSHFTTVLSVPDLDPLLRTEATVGAAQALERQGRLRDAALVYEHLVQEAVHDPSNHASIKVVIGWCRCLYELGDLTRVTEIGAATMQELDRLSAWQSDSAIELLATVAAAHFELGDLQQAERLLREGLERAERMSSPRARAAVLWNASHLASERGQHREALELAEEALAYFRHGNDRRSAARLLSQYGYLLLRQEPPRVDEARSTLEEALSILREHGARYELGYVLTELSRAYLLKGEVRDAVGAAEQSLSELGPEAALERARAATALAAALAADGARDRAAELFTTAAETLSRMNTSRQAARAWVELGEMLVQAGDTVSAVNAFRKATAAMNLGAAPSNVGGSDVERALATNAEQD